MCDAGATGYVAGPIIARLLAAGHRVRATARWAAQCLLVPGSGRAAQCLPACLGQGVRAGRAAITCVRVCSGMGGIVRGRLAAARRSWARVEVCEQSPVGNPITARAASTVRYK